VRDYAKRCWGEGFCSRAGAPPWGREGEEVRRRGGRAGGGGGGRRAGAPSGPTHRLGAALEEVAWAASFRRITSHIQLFFSKNDFLICKFIQVSLQMLSNLHSDDDRERDAEKQNKKI
jgi:hypothetical protein